MLYNLETLRSALLNGLKKSALSTTLRDRWINEAQDDVLTELDPENLKTDYTFSSVANVRKYYSEVEFHKIYSVIDTTNEITLTPLTEYEIEEYDNGSDETGTPYYYSTEGLSWTKAQPAAASVITVVSDNTGDTSQKIRINGVVGGVEDTELLSLNGTTAVNGLKQFTEIRQLVKDGQTSGVVTATSDLGVTELAKIPSYLLGKQYQIFKLYDIPNGVNVYRLRGIRRPKPLINIQDIPDLPEAYHELIEIGALMRGARYLHRQRYQKFLQTTEWAPKIEKFKKQSGSTYGRKAPIIRGGSRIVLDYGIQKPVG